MNCCILFTATTRNTILHHPLKVPCCFVSNLWTRKLWNYRLHRHSQLVLETESTLFLLWRQRCVQAGHSTFYTQLIFLHDQKMFEVHFQDSIGNCCAAPFCALAPAPRPASASPAPRGGPAAPSNLAFPNPSVKGLDLHPAKACETR